MLNSLMPTLLAAACSFAMGVAFVQERPAPAPVASETKTEKVAVESRGVMGQTFENGYVLHAADGVSGMWVQRSYKSPFAALYSDGRVSSEKVAVLGFSRNQEGGGHEFAIVSGKEGVYFQIRDEKGQFHFIPATALLKLDEKK